MNQFSPKSLKSCRNLFRDSLGASLQAVRERVSQEGPGNQRRDTLSALDAIPRLFGRPLVDIVASPPVLRNLFASHNGPQLGVSPKRYSNIKSEVITAARKYGSITITLTKRLAMSEAWTDLLALVPDKDYRSALRRLACFASATGIDPSKVSSELLLGLYEALETEELLKNPRAILHNTVGYWNMCRRRIAGWPQIPLSSPFPTKKFILALESFPISFQDDVRRWRSRLVEVDPFDANLPAVPQRIETAEHNLKSLLRFASALIEAGVLRQTELENLKDLLSAEIVKTGLKIFMTRTGNKPTGYIRQYAWLMYAIASRHCHLPEEELKELKAMADRLERGKIRGMRPTVANKLKPFDDPANYQKLLHYPFEERDRGLRQKNPLKAAKFIDRALAAAICIYLALRMRNLHTIKIGTNLRKAGGKWFVSFDDQEMKGNREHGMEMPAEVAKLLELYIEGYRPLLPGSEGPYLFAGKKCGPRHHSALRSEFSKHVLKHTGLRVNPHLTRHILGKHIVEKDPALIEVLSQFLGHKSTQTTISYYLQNDGRAASRKLNQILETALSVRAPTKRRGK
jgi:integrase